MQVFITVVDHFDDGKKFYPKLRTCFLPFVDNPPIPVIICMNIRVGQLCNVRMAQIRKGAEDEDIPADTRSVVG